MGSPVTIRNKTDSNLTPLIGNKDRKPLRLVDLPEKTCPPGSPLEDAAGLEAEEGEVSLDAAPALLRIKGSINDNYCLQNPVPVAQSVKNVTNVEGQNFSVSVRQPVLCPVVSPVPFVLSVRGQSQKKDGSPSSKVKQEINFVNDVFMSSLCGVGVRVRVCVNHFSSKTTRPRDMLFFLKDTSSIEDENCSRHANLSVRLFARDIIREVPPPKV